MARSILFYTDSRALGGAERALFMLARALERESWESTLLLEDAPGADPVAAAAEASGLAVRRVEPLPLGLTGARRVPAAARYLRREGADVFHAHLSWPLAAKWGLAAAVLARLPAVVATVQLIPEMELDRSSRLQLRALSQGVDRCIAVSHDVAAQLIERFGWPAAKVEVVHNAVDLDRIAVPASPGLRAELGVEGDAPLVLTTARLEEQKGHSVLLRAAAGVPDAVFVLAGEGALRGALEAEAAELGVAERIRFLGERTDVPELLAACDVFALPSLYEGSSLAVLEAMAAGRPVVSSMIGGTDELIEDGLSGLLVPPGDADALADALRRLLADRELGATLAARARERVERDFTREAMARRIARLYEEVLSGDARGGS